MTLVQRPSRHIVRLNDFIYERNGIRAGVLQLTAIQTRFWPQMYDIVMQVERLQAGTDTISGYSIGYFQMELLLHSSTAFEALKFLTTRNCSSLSDRMYGAITRNKDSCKF